MGSRERDVRRLRATLLLLLVALLAAACGSSSETRSTGARAAGSTRAAATRRPSTVAVGSHDTAILNVRADTLTLFDIRTRRRIGTASAGPGATHLVNDDGDLFVVDTRGNALLEFAVTPPTPGVARLALQRIARLVLPGSPFAIAADPARRRVWVTLTGADRVAEISVANVLHPRVVARYPTGGRPDAVKVDARNGAVSVADAATGIVQQIRP
jgi:DNA-binding beta-propeller fold protein YncE